MEKLLAHDEGAHGEGAVGYASEERVTERIARLAELEFGLVPELAAERSYRLLSSSSRFTVSEERIIPSPNTECDPRVNLNPGHPLSSMNTSISITLYENTSP